MSQVWSTSAVRQAHCKQAQCKPLLTASITASFLWYTFKMKIRIDQKYNPIFREKREDSEQKIKTIVSSEENNNNEHGEKN